MKRRFALILVFIGGITLLLLNAPVVGAPSKRGGGEKDIFDFEVDFRDAFNGTVTEKSAKKRIYEFIYDFENDQQAPEWTLKPAALKDGVMRLTGKGGVFRRFRSTPFTGLTVKITGIIDKGASGGFGALVYSGMAPTTGYYVGIDYPIDRERCCVVLDVSKKDGEGRLVAKKPVPVPQGRKITIEIHTTSKGVALVFGGAKVLTAKYGDGFEPEGRLWIGGFTPAATIDKVEFTGTLKEDYIAKLSNLLYARKCIEIDTDLTARVETKETPLSAELPEMKLLFDAAVVAKVDEARALRRSRGATMEGVLALLEEAEKIDPEYAPIYLWRGRLYQIAQQWFKAIECYEKAAEVNDRFYEAYRDAADVLMLDDVRDYRGAKKYLKTAIDMNTEYGAGYASMANLDMRFWDMDKAMKNIELARRYDPDDPQVVMISQKIETLGIGPRWLDTFNKESSHYDVYTNVSKDYLNEVSYLLEAMFSMYRSVFDVKLTRKQKPRVYAFHTGEGYRYFLQRLGMSGGLVGRSAGVFIPALKIFCLIDEGDGQYGVLFHEGFHQFFDLFTQDPPIWINEGFAEYFFPSKYNFKTHKFDNVGGPHPWRIRLLKSLIKNGKALRFKDVMMMPVWVYQSQNVGRNYALVWGIVNYLVNYEKNGKYVYRGILQEYLRAVVKGKSQKECYEKTFGRMTDKATEQMEKEWVDYILAMPNP